MQLVIADETVKSDKAYKQKNVTGSLPLLECDDGSTIGESLAICKYLARVGPDGAGLLGGSALERVQVEQWLSIAYSQVKPLISVIAHAIFGILAPFQDEYNDAVKSLKDQLRGLNTRLSAGEGKSWIVGD